MHIAGKAVYLAVSFPIKEIFHFDNHAFFKIKQNCENIIQTCNMLFNEVYFSDQQLENMSCQKFILNELNEMNYASST